MTTTLEKAYVQYCVDNQSKTAIEEEIVTSWLPGHCQISYFLQIHGESRTTVPQDEDSATQRLSRY